MLAVFCREGQTGYMNQASACLLQVWLEALEIMLRWMKLFCELFQGRLSALLHCWNHSSTHNTPVSGVPWYRSSSGSSLRALIGTNCPNFSWDLHRHPRALSQEPNFSLSQGIEFFHVLWVCLAVVLLLILSSGQTELVLQVTCIPYLSSDVDCSLSFIC